MIRAEEGDIVSVDYTLKFENGRVYDSSIGRKPLTIKLGDNVMIPGFEKAIEGMQMGDKKQVFIPAREAFGLKEQELIQRIKREFVPSHINCEVGQRLSIAIDDQKEIIGTITNVSDQDIVLDANPIQAGQNFMLDIELLDIKADDDE